MKRAEWLACREPTTLLSAVWSESRLTVRKLRLLAIACCRRLSDVHAERVFRDLLRCAERVAEDQLAPEMLKIAVDDLRASWGNLEDCQNVAEAAAYLAFGHTTNQESLGSALNALASSVAWQHCPEARVHDRGWLLRGSTSWFEKQIECSPPESNNPMWRKARALEQEAQAAIIRDILDPFWIGPFDPEWRTQTAVALARHLYDSREFSAMPILADAIQDAGCENDHILNHLRDPNVVHVRGCWVLDGVRSVG